MRKSWKRYDVASTAWDMDAGCRKFITNNKTTRRLRKTLRKQFRKKLNQIFLETP